MPHEQCRTNKECCILAWLRARSGLAAVDGCYLLGTLSCARPRAGWHVSSVARSVGMEAMTGRCAGAFGGQERQRWSEIESGRGSREGTSSGSQMGMGWIRMGGLEVYVPSGDERWVTRFGGVLGAAAGLGPWLRIEDGAGGVWPDSPPDERVVAGWEARRGSECAAWMREGSMCVVAASGRRTRRRETYAGAGPGAGNRTIDPAERGAAESVSCPYAAGGLRDSGMTCGVWTETRPGAVENRIGTPDPAQ